MWRISLATPKLPSALWPRRNTAKKRTKAWYLLFAVLFIASVIFRFWTHWIVPQHLITVTPSPFPSNSKFPRSAIPAHLSDEYEQWRLPDDVLKQLWAAVENAPLNPITSRRCLGLTIVNEGMIAFASNMICSAQLAGIPSNSHVFFALDDVSYDALLPLGAQAVIFATGNFTKAAVNNHHLIEFYDILKLKPTVVHQLLLWNVDAILIDADIVFLSNALTLFTDSADFEVQCDSKEYYRIPYWNLSVPWQVNLGFCKVHPTPVVMKLMPIWLQKMYAIRNIHEQSAFRRILSRRPRWWLDNETAIVDVRKLFVNERQAENLTVRFLDPMLAANAGGLWQEGRHDWIAEAKRRNIKRPVMIHFFHIGTIQAKLRSMHRKDLWFVGNDSLCAKEQPRGAALWPLWNKPSKNSNKERVSTVQS
jgi:hypothetical protein